MKPALALRVIKQKIIDREYYLSSHAEEEMADDLLERSDIENAILMGRIEKRFVDDFRGTRYRIQGPARDSRMIHVICRINELDEVLIITVYIVGEVK